MPARRAGATSSRCATSPRILASRRARCATTRKRASSIRRGAASSASTRDATARGSLTCLPARRSASRSRQCASCSISSDLEKGLLDPGRRGEQRLYTRRDRARLAYVLAGKAVGFSLEEVREMLDLYDVGDGQVTQLKVALTKFDERIERLERQKSGIDRVIAELTRASAGMRAKLAGAMPGKVDTGFPSGIATRSEERRVGKERRSRR